MLRKDIAIADNKPRSLGSWYARDFRKCRAGHRDLMAKEWRGELDCQQLTIGPNCRCSSLVVLAGAPTRAYHVAIKGTITRHSTK